jgi:acyl carrier protein
MMTAISDTTRSGIVPSRVDRAHTAPTIEGLVEEFLTEALGFAPGVVVPSARFWDDYGVGSLDLLELAVDAQERFGVEITDEALREIETVADFGRCVAEAIAHRDECAAST